MGCDRMLRVMQFLTTMASLVNYFDVTALVSPASSSAWSCIMVSSSSFSFNGISDQCCLKFGVFSLRPATPKRWVFCGPVGICLNSVCSKRFSVIMISITSFGFLLASFGAPSSTAKVQPMGVISHKSLRHCPLCMQTRRQAHWPCCSLVSQPSESSHFGLSRLDDQRFAMSILGRHSTSKFVPDQRPASRWVRDSSFRVPMNFILVFCKPRWQLQTWWVCILCLIWLPSFVQLTRFCDPSACQAPNCCPCVFPMFVTTC